MLTERQEQLLILIVADYVKTAEPVSSGGILEKNPEFDYSSALIRKEMKILEDEGYITKLDSSSSRTSGRVPTNKGYELYLRTLKTNPDSILSIKEKLDKLLKERKDDIDNLLQDAMELINESTNTLTISKDVNSEERIVDINTYQIREGWAIIVVVTSTGNVINNETNLNGIKFSDFSKAIGILSKRIKDISIVDLKQTLNNIKEIASIEIKEIEDKFQEVVKLLISKILNSNSKIKGMNSLITSSTLDVKTQIGSIFKMIENNSIWDLIKNDGTITNDMSGTTIDVDALDGVSVVKKDINIGDRKRELTILGSKNQDYEKLFSMLEYLGKKLGE